MQTNPAVEQNKNINGPRIHRISPVEKEKVYGGNDLPKSQIFIGIISNYNNNNNNDTYIAQIRKVQQMR